MIWTKRSPYRWRKKFALFPKRVGDKWVWLQRYAWRRLTPDEVPDVDPIYTVFWREYSLPNGYLVWRYYVFCGGQTAVDWHQPMNKLKVVS